MSMKFLVLSSELSVKGVKCTKNILYCIVCCIQRCTLSHAGRCLL